MRHAPPQPNGSRDTFLTLGANARLGLESQQLHRLMNPLNLSYENPSSTKMRQRCATRVFARTFIFETSDLCHVRHMSQLTVHIEVLSRRFSDSRPTDRDNSQGVPAEVIVGVQCSVSIGDTTVCLRR